MDEQTKAIKARLDELVAGTQLKPWTCNCGAIHGESATVRAVRPPDDDSWAGDWFMWTLEMVNDQGERANWTTGLSAVLDLGVIREAFAPLGI